MYLADDATPIQTKFTIEIRERFERRLDRDFLESNSDNRSDFFTRIRPGVTVTYGKNFSAYAEYQFAHTLGITPGDKSWTTNSDARELYVRYKGPEATVTVGRQKAVMGGERLVGMGEWTNVGRSYDGIRLQNKEWDLLLAKIGVSVPKPRNAELAVAGRTWRAGQTLAIYKGDNVAAGDVRIYTLDHSQKIARDNWDFDYDVAAQFSRNTGKDHEAWAAHFGAGYRHDAKNRIYLDLNAASGGSSSTKSETFDNLFPTNHKFYGSMDMQGWKNMTEVALGWQHKLDAKSDLHLHGHWFRLMDAKDAWYSAGGSPNRRVGGVFRDPTGAAGKEVGFELDLEATHRFDPSTSIQAGIGVFEPGKFVQRMNGGDADRQIWFYLQIMKRF